MAASFITLQCAPANNFHQLNDHKTNIFPFNLKNI